MLSKKMPPLLIKNASRTKPACNVTPGRAWNNLHHYVKYITHWNLIREAIPAFTNPCCFALILEIYNSSQCCFEQAKTQAVLWLWHIYPPGEIFKKVAFLAARLLIYYSSSFVDFGKIQNQVESLPWLELTLRGSVKPDRSL